jgi:DNA-binding response OmpR family regulator
MKMLIADNDRDLVDMLTYWLRGHGYEMLRAFDGVQAVEQWRKGQPDLVLLDAELPRIDGFEVCRRMSSESTSLLLLVGNSLSEEDEVRALSLGADDCLHKPLSPRRLLARIRALTRRAIAAPHAVTGDSILIAGSIRLDAMRHQVSRDGHMSRLTPIESRLLHLLMTHSGQVLPTALIVERVWGYDDGDTGLVKTHIRHLRQKVERDPAAPEHIQTVPGVGYTFMDRATHEDDALALDPIPTFALDHAAHIAQTLHAVGA